MFFRFDELLFKKTSENKNKNLSNFYKTFQTESPFQKQAIILPDKKLQQFDVITGNILNDPIVIRFDKFLMKRRNERENIT